MSFYCFESFSGIHLAEIPSQYQAEFEENSAWLRFGFHASDDHIRYDHTTPEKAGEDYGRVVNELCRIVGERSIDHIPRIHCWSGNRATLSAMRERG